MAANVGLFCGFAQFSLLNAILGKINIVKYAHVAEM
jgi:hypothetical protein